MAKKIIVSVTTDLITDQRVHKVCTSLYNAKGYDILVVGRQRKLSLPMDKRKYTTYRFKLWFEKGPLFYATFNIRLFFFLLFNKADILLANDLDTLLPNYLVSKLKGIPLAYDNHEYFVGVPELKDRPFVRNVWKTIEKNIFPKLKYIYTDNDSKKKLFEDEYKVPVKVVRNVPVFNLEKETNPVKLDLPEGKKILLYQGAGINVDRGTEELTEAMQYLDDSFLLLYIGSGDVINDLKLKVKALKITDKVIFIDKVPLAILRQYTKQAHLGFSLDKPVSENYIYSLPNKLFDYVHAGVPVLVSRLIEIEKMVNKYDIGAFIDSHDPTHIADKIKEIFSNDALLEKWKSNLPQAAKEVNWQNEEKVLLSVYDAIDLELSTKK